LNVTMLLCDAAEEINGKLYILGGGWTHLLKPNVPTNMALAMVVHVPWEEAGKQHKVELSLLEESGEPVVLGGKPVKVAGAFEVGHTTGARPGSELAAPLALQFSGLVLPPGEYTWELLVNGEPGATVVFGVPDVTTS
jgi:hypothetical protein